jgi:hypothetical protein
MKQPAPAEPQPNLAKERPFESFAEPSQLEMPSGVEGEKAAHVLVLSCQLQMTKGISTSLPPLLSE